MANYCLMGTEYLFQIIKKIPEMVNGDSCTTVNVSNVTDLYT